jgi:hypothetical protein
MKPFTTTYEVRLNQLLQDFGYRYEGTTLISKSVRGFINDRIVGRFRSISVAVEYLIPIIHENEFYERWSKLGESS